MAEERNRLSLTTTEVLGILAFWTALAVITAAGRTLDPRVELAPDIASAVVSVSFIEYAIWALLTVPIVWLSSRYSIESGNRVLRVIALVALGVVIAIAVDSILSVAREHLFPRPSGRGFRGGRGRIRGFEFLDDLMVYFAILGAGIARDYFFRYRARLEETTMLQARAAQLESQLAQAQLSVLRNQLNPHFLFNTLHAVSALVERDPRGVRKMISRLSELLRFTLEESPAQETTLEKELDLVRRYVDIMEIRFQGRLSIDAEIENAAQAACVPSLLLQPIVENAIKHGIGEHEGSGEIHIRAFRDGDELVITVRDNGPGISSESSELGVGIRNTRARLDQLYGTGNHLTLRNAEGGGAIAEIRIPWRMNG